MQATNELPPEAPSLMEWLRGLQERHFVIRLGLANGEHREGRLVHLGKDFVLLSPAAPGRQMRAVTTAQVVTVDVVEGAR